MAWLSHMGGRLKSDFRYSIGLVYNTFPWPEANSAQRRKVEELAQDVLDARLAHPTSSLADLYDPDTMPANLRKAHAKLDAAVDRLYRKKALRQRPRPGRASVRALRKTGEPAVRRGTAEQAHRASAQTAREQTGLTGCARRRVATALDGGGSCGAREEAGPRIKSGVTG